jgi:hypothetical protein
MFRGTHTVPPDSSAAGGTATAGSRAAIAAIALAQLDFEEALQVVIDTAYSTTASRRPSGRTFARERECVYFRRFAA